jgi:hypothetical protein
MGTDRGQVMPSARPCVFEVASCDLKLVASQNVKGFSGYQALLKAYISEGLRRDEAVHLFGPAARLAEALKKRGVSAKLIEQAAQEASTQT